MAWHRQFWQLHEYDKSPWIITVLVMGLPLAILLSGIWTKLRGALLVIAPIVVLTLCIGCTWTTIDTFMHFYRSVPPLDEYTVYRKEILWGSFHWGFLLPALMTAIAAGCEFDRRELIRHKFSLFTCSISLVGTSVANLFVIWLSTAKIRDVEAIGLFLKQLLGYYS